MLLFGLVCGVPLSVEGRDQRFSFTCVKFGCCIEKSPQGASKEITQKTLTIIQERDDGLNQVSGRSNVNGNKF